MHGEGWCYGYCTLVKEKITLMLEPLQINKRNDYFEVHNFYRTHETLEGKNREI